jgi:hypothetical protein
MTFSKNKFFLLLSLVVITPFLIYKMLWLAGTQTATGTMGFVGKEYAGQIVHVYSVIKFPAGGNTVWFNGNDNILFKPGEKVPVRYVVKNPKDARINYFVSVWGDTVVYGGIPMLIICVAYLHPLIVPRKSRIRINSKRPYVHNLNGEEFL